MEETLKSRKQEKTVFKSHVQLCQKWLLCQIRQKCKMDIRFSSVQVVDDLKQSQVVGGRDWIPIGASLPRALVMVVRILDYCHNATDTVDKADKVTIFPFYDSLFIVLFWLLKQYVLIVKVLNIKNMTKNNLQNPIPSYITTVNNLRHILPDFSVHITTYTHVYTYKSWLYCQIVCKSLCFSLCILDI